MSLPFSTTSTVSGVPARSVHAHDGGIDARSEVVDVRDDDRGHSAALELCEGAGRPDRRQEIPVARPVERRLPVGAEEQAAVRPQTRCRGLTEEEGSTEPPRGDVSADGSVGREARHQGNRDLGLEGGGQPLRLGELHLEEAPPVDRLHHGLHLAAEACRHAAREHDHRHRPRPEGVRPGLDGLVEPRFPGRRQGDEVGGQRGLDGALDGISASRSRPVDEPPAKPFEGGGVEPVAFERCARLGIDLVEDHLQLTGAGSEVAYGARWTPASVTIAAIRSAGVTSNAGLRAGNRSVTSAPSRSSIGIAFQVTVAPIPARAARYAGTRR